MTMKRAAKPEGEVVVRTVCESCHVGCGVLVHVKDGKIEKIEGDPAHPLNEGIICPKGITAKEVVYHPDRLKHPMKRVGEKGEGKWQRISWDEALDTIAGKLTEIIEKYGPLSIAGTIGGKPTKITEVMYCLINSLGSTNVGHSDASFCWGPYPIAEVSTYGHYTFTEMGADCKNGNCIIVWGGNPAQSHPTYARWISQARKRGAKLIVVDPRFTAMASKADLWLQVRPGTDSALALGMLNVIINEGLYDREFVDRWCVGFDELRERVQEFPPERVAEITWVPAEDIVKAARMYATIKPATMYPRVAVETHNNSVQGMRALACLVSVTGNIDVKGGNVFTTTPPGLLPFHVARREYWKDKPSLEEEEEKRFGAKEFPLLCGSKSAVGCPHPGTLIKAAITGKPYPVKAWFISNNVLLCLPNSGDVYQALKKVDMVVVMDFFMTPTAQLADIVLPVAHWSEADFVVKCYSNYIVARPKAIEPVGECWDEMKIALEILKRMGLKLCFYDADSAEGYNDAQLKPLGMTFEDFKKKHVIMAPIPYKRYEKEGFQTPSGKVELYSSVFKDNGYDPLPHYMEPLQSPVSTPKLAKDYPLILTAGKRRIGFMHSEGRQVGILRELAPDPEIEIHPETAEGLGIKEGDWVYLEIPGSKERIKQRANLTRAMHPKVVNCEAHWWYPEKPGPDYGHWEVNINKLISGESTPGSEAGTIAFRGLLCKVYKAEED